MACSPAARPSAPGTRPGRHPDHRPGPRLRPGQPPLDIGLPGPGLYPHARHRQHAAVGRLARDIRRTAGRDGHGRQHRPVHRPGRRRRHRLRRQPRHRRGARPASRPPRRRSPAARPASRPRPTRPRLLHRRRPRPLALVGQLQPDQHDKLYPAPGVDGTTGTPCARPSCRPTATRPTRGDHPARRRDLRPVAGPARDQHHDDRDAHHRHRVVRSRRQHHRRRGEPDLPGGPRRDGRARGPRDHRRDRPRRAAGSTQWPPRAG